MLVLVAVILAPVLVRQRNGGGRVARIAPRCAARCFACAGAFRSSATRAAGPMAAGAQLGAWAIQLLACAALFEALGLDGQLGIGAAAAVLFAVNVTAVVPATPSNIGVFQLAVISVLTTGFGVSAADALAYGVILQAVEIATAVAPRPAGAGPRGPHLVRHAAARAERRAGAPLGRARTPRPSPASAIADPEAHHGLCCSLSRPMALSNISGFPRIGPQRELKFATEGYWRGEVSDAELLETAKAHPARQLALHAGARGST